MALALEGVVDKVKGLEPPAFDQMFRNGVRYRLGSGIEAAVEVHDAGTLNLATGRVTACDPFWVRRSSVRSRRSP